MVASFYAVRIMPLARATRSASKPRVSVLYVGTDEAASRLDAARQAAERYAEPKKWRRVMVQRRGAVFQLYRFLTANEASKARGNMSRLRREHVANIVVERR